VGTDGCAKAVSRHIIRSFIMEIGAVEGEKFAGSQPRRVVAGNTSFNLFVLLSVLHGPNPFPSSGTLDGLVNVYSMV